VKKVGELWSTNKKVLVAHMGALKTREWKMREWKTRHQVAGVKTREWKTRHQMTGAENAGVENVAPSSKGGKRGSGQFQGRTPGAETPL